MIFNKLLKKVKGVVKDKKGNDTIDTQKPLPQQSSDTVSTQTTKKTKVHKENKALVNTKGRKKRSNRTVHNKKSFHPKVMQPIKDRVNIYDIIERPVVTEKAANKSERGVYTFLVREKATKHTIADAIETIYGVKPKKIRIARNAPKKKRVRISGREREFGMTVGRKKAYVFLREGDKIQLT